MAHLHSLANEAQPHINTESLQVNAIEGQRTAEEPKNSEGLSKRTMEEPKNILYVPSSFSLSLSMC